MKRVISLLAVLAMVVSCVALAGCGHDMPVQQNKIAIDAEEEYFLDIPSELKGTKVKYATWSTDRDGDPDFTDLTGMELEIVSVPQGDYVAKIAGLIAADQAPDIIIENSEFPRTLDLLQPITVETTGIDVTDPFWDQDIVDLYTVGKYSYLLAGSRDITSRAGACTFFNKTIFEENGVKTPQDYVDEDNWNLDTLEITMKKIKEKMGFKRRGAVIDAMSFLRAYGANEVEFDREKDEFRNATGTPEMLWGLEKLLGWSGEELCELMLEGSHNSLDNGTGALQICGSYGLHGGTAWFYQMDPDDLDFTYLPKKNAGDAEYAYTMSCGATGICKGARNPKGAGYYLRYSMASTTDESELIGHFKNEKAMKLCKDLHEHASGKLPYFARGVRLCAFPDTGSLVDGLMGQVIWSSKDQIKVKLSSASNNIDAGVKKANEKIRSVIDDQD